MKNYSDPFLTKKMVKKWYCGNEGLSLAWDRIEVRQVAPFNTTDMDADILNIKCVSV